MSFRNPFNRYHAPKKSAISRTAEREFEREYKKLEQLDEDSKKIHKDMKLCIESQAAQSKSELKMSSDLLNGPLCRDDNELRALIEQWAQATHRHDQLMHELNLTCYKAVSEPMKKFGTIFPNLQIVAKKREQSLQELNRCQAKMDKYSERERTGTNRVKLHQGQKALDTAKEDYDSHNSALMNDMPHLHENRIEYIDPSYQALIKSQIKYYTEAHQTYTELLSNMQKDETTNIQKNLDDIKALTITMDN